MLEKFHPNEVLMVFARDLSLVYTVVWSVWSEDRTDSRAEIDKRSFPFEDKIIQD